MVSDQMRRENQIYESGVHVFIERAPKMASHFESLSDKVAHNFGKDLDDVESATVVTESGIGGHEREAPARENEKNRHEQMQRDVKGEQRMETGGGRVRKGPSLDEISQHRGNAQENSMKAVRAAEERYEKAKELGGSTWQNVKQSAGAAKDNIVQGVQPTSETAANQTQPIGDAAAEKGQQSKDTLSMVGETVKQKAVGMKDSAVDTAKKFAGYTGEKAAALKETTVDTGKAATGYFGKATEVVKDKALEAKDGTVEIGKGAAGYVGKTAKVVKEKATAKDVTVETGKGAAGYVGNAAEVVKDKGVVTGWAATEYTCQKIVGATVAVANVTANVAGYAGEKAVAVKDMVAGAGVKSKDYVGEKVANMKDAVLASEESAREYAARKKAEKEMEMETKKSDQYKGENVGEITSDEKHGASGIAGKVPEQTNVVSGGGKSEKEEAGGVEEESAGGGGIFRVIGETIVEIGQATKDLIIGQGEGPETGKICGKGESPRGVEK